VLRAPYPRCDQKTAIQFIDHTLAKPPFAVERVQTTMDQNSAPRPTGTCSTKAIDHVKIKPRTQPVEQAARHQSDQEDLPRGAEQQHHANASVAEHRNPPRMAVSAGADGL
jgi:hypothetical protein